MTLFGGMSLMKPFLDQVKKPPSKKVVSLLGLSVVTIFRDIEQFISQQFDHRILWYSVIYIGGLNIGREVTFTDHTRTKRSGGNNDLKIRNEHEVTILYCLFK